MSNQDADLGGRFLDGTLRQELEENVEKGAASESSSSSDGSNKPSSDQSAPSNFQRPESGKTSFPVVTMAQSQEGEGDASPVAGARTFQLLEIPEKEMSNVSVRNHNHYHGLGIGIGNANSYHGLFPLDSSSSRLPHSPITRGSGDGYGSPFTRQSQHQLTVHNPCATFGPQEHRFQNLLGQGVGSNSFHPVELLNMPIQKRMELNMGLSLPLQFEGTPTNSNEKMKMTWHDNIPAGPNLHPLNLLPQGRGQAQNYGFPHSTWYFRNTVYDPMYEAMGLPIDPHLRMFLARRDHGDYEEH